MGISLLKKGKFRLRLSIDNTESKILLYKKKPLTHSARLLENTLLKVK